MFNGYLYIGAGDTTTGYSVWRTNASGDLPYTLTPVVTGGAGRGPVMTSVVSMYPYKGRLYVGSAGGYSTLLPSSELIRINPNDSWESIAGNARLAPYGLIFPLSGLGDGFGNPFNAHIWRLQEHNGVLYAGTNDDSWCFGTRRWRPSSCPNSGSTSSRARTASPGRRSPQRLGQHVQLRPEDLLFDDVRVVRRRGQLRPGV